MGFLYPNLVSGTDAWSDWRTPFVGADNSTIDLFVVEFPRAIEADDVVCAGVEIDFDGLDLTADGAYIAVQGDVGGSWHYSNVVVRAVMKGWPNSLHMSNSVLEGTYLISGVNVISSITYGTGHNMSPVGQVEFHFGFRVDYSRGGRLRARRLMVTLNGDGVPHAWAPAAGEVWPE